MSKQNKAFNLFNTNCNCAQAVLLTFAEEINIDLELAKKISFPFGGGLGRSGNICGAITGAIMVLGLKYGDKLNKDQMYQLTRKFINQFHNEFEQIDCKLLTGFDLSIPEQSIKASAQNISETHCSNYIKKSVSLLETLFNNFENEQYFF
ncbi:MAG: C-GCAxxG-C-C family protein [Candidatus Cloacimonetes bacterium]|jgi:C_GCAxxG_C_C family probable redox protein|nr:C-GCAxxG-C-C family protein [Acholeplasmataceae bacterium]MCK9427968.1 C-GCAxxG-C-C family protein [Acholeplasmataceae bacterium]MDD4156406.1 C-GCAxxG-C-C family protein [Candidatus Cloacimonadota bacterium]